MTRFLLTTELCVSIGLGVAVVLAGLSGAVAMPAPGGSALVGTSDAPGEYRVAAADCAGAASEAAAQTGGQVLSVSARQQGGQTVCVVTVLVPGKDGGRPRKQTVTIRP